MVGGVEQVVLIDSMMLDRGADEPHGALRLGQKPAASENRELFLAAIVEIMIGKPEPGALGADVQIHKRHQRAAETPAPRDKRSSPR